MAYSLLFEGDRACVEFHRDPFRTDHIDLCVVVPHEHSDVVDERADLRGVLLRRCPGFVRKLSPTQPKPSRRALRANSCNCWC